MIKAPNLPVIAVMFGSLKIVAWSLFDFCLLGFEICLPKAG